MDALVFALANLGWISQGRTEYDQDMTFLKIESDLALGLQNKIMKLLEQIWEALPQLALAITYYVHNKYYIWFSETRVLGVPTTIFSMILSSGSVVMGLFSGAAATRDVVFIKAVKNTNVKQMEFLVKLPLLPADPNMDVSKGVPAIEHAIQNEFWETLDCLVEAGVTAKADNSRCDEQLLLASEKGQVVGVNSLVRAGGNVNKIDENGSTPIYLASRNGHVGVVNSLIQAGSDVNIKNLKEHTPLQTASEQGHEEVVRCLIRAGGNVNTIDGNGSTLIHAASRNGHVAVVDSLIQAGGDVNIKNLNEETPLQTASKQGQNREVVEYLVRALTEAIKEDQRGNRPSQWTSKEGQEKLVDRLLQVQGDIVKAAAKDQWEVVKFLAKARCEVNKQDGKGTTPLLRASEDGHADVVKTLIQAGGKVKKARWEGYHPTPSCIKEWPCGGGGHFDPSRRRCTL